jgi:AraC-like DNA-binding protein
MTVPIDVLLRTVGTSVGLVFLLVVTTSAGRRRGDLMLVIGCAVAYLLCSSPARPCCTTPSTLPLLMGAAAFPFALWRLARVVLEDDSSVPGPAWAGLTVLLVSAFWATPDYFPIPSALRTGAAIANKLAALAFVGAALWTAWRSWDGDLLESRRRLRWWLVVYLSAYGLVVMAGEVYLLGERPPAWLDLLNAAAIGATLLATLIFFVQLRPAAMDILFAPPVQPPAQPEVQPEADAAPPGNDEPLLERLEALMSKDHLYRESELTVRALAERAAVPEYILRRLINEKLGYRNFAAYANEFRLREVESRLRDPQWARRPILTLALEAGFGSIGPFNRAFRERYGVTPTEFRNRASRSSEAMKRLSVLSQEMGEEL